VKPAAFAYARAESLDHALELLWEGGEDTKLLAGGQSLIPLMAYRLARPSHLVDIGGLVGLDALAENTGGLTVGALTRHAALEESSLDGPWQALREAAAHVGHYPIRVRGTFGGSLAHADPAAELPVVVTALDGEVVVRSRSGERRLPAIEFFLGPFTTVLEPEEAVVEIRLPRPPDGARTTFQEFAERAGDFALASAAVGVAVDEQGRVSWARVALGSAGPTPLRAARAEELLVGSEPSDAAIEEAARAASVDCEPAGDAAFRRELVVHLVRRALRRAVGR
jgi:CO/xanthine dehydrogenase FAD-binding subunit